MSETATPSAKVLKPHTRILELDALRALAAINLVLFHYTLVYQNRFGYTSPLGFVWPFGAYGVEMFFILSGFLVAGSGQRLSLGDFIANRSLRIVPALAVDIVLCALILGPIFTVLPLGEYFTHQTFFDYFWNIVGAIHAWALFKQFKKRV